VHCDHKRKFTAETLKDRLEELAAADKPALQDPQGRRVIELTTQTSHRWIVDDMTNDRWIELAVHTRSPSGPHDATFVSSLAFSASQGREIGAGAEAVVGDDDAPPKVSTQTIATSGGLIIVAKPKASYPYDARQTNAQGTVMLRVVFKANGAIGPVSVVKAGVLDSFTESSLAAVRKMVFVPATINGVTQTVTKSVEYSFTLY
jgi:TonB family protein